MSAESAYLIGMASGKDPGMINWPTQPCSGPRAAAIAELADGQASALAQLDEKLIQPPLGYDAGPWRSYFTASRALGEASARAALPALEAHLATID